MSFNSFAAFRKSQGEDLANLAKEHFEHDITENDRNLLKSAAGQISTNALIGSIAGIALGGFLAFRLRSRRTAMYKAIRATEKPTHVRFADGREEAIPDITPLLKPTTLGDIAAYTFFGMGGLFVGGELGLWSGTWSAKRKITQDLESRARIEKAFRLFRADVLRKQIDALERGNEPVLEF